MSFDATAFEVVGIGNAIVDVIAEAPDTFLDHMGIEKGIMQLIDRERAELLYAAMRERVETPGGSVANTIAGLGRLGLRAAFIGKVRNDALGRFYARAMDEAGTAFPNPPAEALAPTSRSMIFVSPDGERSMNTYLGAGADLGRGDVPADTFSAGTILFLEGYLFDKPEGKTAFEEAARLARANGGRAGITLSDPFCVNRHRSDFQSLVAQSMDYVIGNEHEWEALYECALDDALDRAAEVCETVVCTRSGAEVWLISGKTRVTVPVERRTPVDATGAGDQFAAGFLYGYARRLPLETAGRMGVIAGSEVIGHMGPRPRADVLSLFREAGLV